MKSIQKLEKLKIRQKEIDDLKEQIQIESSEIFDQFITEIFTNYIELKSFGWTQYTPYFSDVSNCIFSANTDHLYINGVSYEEWRQYETKGDARTEMGNTNWGTWNKETKRYDGSTEEINPKFDKRLKDAIDEIQKFLLHFDNEFFINKFGDHAKITIIKDGISVEDYDHE